MLLAKVANSSWAGAPQNHTALLSSRPLLKMLSRVLAPYVWDKQLLLLGYTRVHHPSQAADAASLHQQAAATNRCVLPRMRGGASRL
jgi:hypothetical protein